ncbi:hypothetical protein [Streptomyces sp. NPDC054995]
MLVARDPEAPAELIERLSHDPSAGVRRHGRGRPAAGGPAARTARRAGDHRGRGGGARPSGHSHGGHPRGGRDPVA